MNRSDKGASLFDFFGRKKFEALVKKWGVDKGVRGFSTWKLTNALISCFVLRLGSYRDFEATLGTRLRQSSTSSGMSTESGLMILLLLRGAGSTHQ